MKKKSSNKPTATKTHMIRARITDEQRDKLDYLYAMEGINDSEFIRLSIDKIKVKP